MKDSGRGGADDSHILTPIGADAGTPASGMGAGTGEEVAAETPSVQEITDSADPLAQMRALIAGAIPDLVPELLAGDSLEALIASVEPARQAYQRIVEQVRDGSSIPAGAASGSREPQGLPRPVPAGQPGRQGARLDLDGLSPSAKIAEGLRRRNG